MTYADQKGLDASEGAVTFYLLHNRLIVLFLLFVLFCCFKKTLFLVSSFMVFYKSAS